MEMGLCERATGAGSTPKVGRWATRRVREDFGLRGAALSKMILANKNRTPENSAHWSRAP